MARSCGCGDFFIDAPKVASTFARMVHTCQSGFETLLARELGELHGTTVEEKGPGWVESSAVLQPASDGAERELPPSPSLQRAGKRSAIEELAFAHLTLPDPVELRAGSVNALARQAAEFFLGTVRDERIETAWPNLWLAPADVAGLGRRAGAVEAAFAELLRRKLSRVAKLATGERPRTPGRARGLFVFFADFGRMFVAREVWNHGPRRMADDPLAPSRSYLKVEEAYGVLGREPAANETVCDLGAAPGGWSYSAARRGARVVAIDNGPLKGGALDHASIEHRREDAFGLAPRGGEQFDWLFCDLVEEPHHVLRSIVAPWLAHGWCRRFVINLKFGRVDPIGLLRELRTPESPLARHAAGVRIRHLFHDREEFTLVGEVTAAGDRSGK